MTPLKLSESYGAISILHKKIQEEIQGVDEKNRMMKVSEADQNYWSGLRSTELLNSIYYYKKALELE